MSIKYADITIIRNLEQENIFRRFERYFGYENTTNNKDIIIIRKVIKSEKVKKPKKQAKK
ncbi:MAG: hypothetical protein VKL39_23460 [Leptolyngbyaceae bacterium]|nr:hypothetical protein [Leptolyngbyaceae bacterium]